jgi:hypothetical protein
MARIDGRACAVDGGRKGENKAVAVRPLKRAQTSQWLGVFVHPDEHSPWAIFDLPTPANSDFSHNDEVLYSLVSGTRGS